MAASDFFTGEAAPARNPLRPWGLSRLAVGAVHVVAGGVVAATLVPDVRALIAGAEYGLLALDVTLDGVRMVVAAVLCIRGVRMMSAAVGSLTRFVLPPAAPADLDAAETEAALVRRDPGALRARPGMRYRFLQHWFPGHLPAVTARMRAVADSGLGEAWRATRLALLVGTGFAAVAGVPGLREGLFAGAMPSVPWTFLAIYGVAAALHLVLAVRALPSAVPRGDVRAFRSDAHGGGDPAHIPHDLQRELAVIAPAGGLPSRARETGFVMERGAVRDAGTFEGRLFIETQPHLTPVPEAPSARPLIVAGSVVQLLALLWWLGAPAVPATLTTGTGVGFATTLLYGGQLLAGALLARLGARLVATGGELLRGFRFESLAVLLDVRGTVARSHVRIGKGMYDSIESDNLVVRSDVYVTGHCAALLTESREPMGPRQVLGMIATERAAEVELLVQRYLWRFERHPASIAPVNLRDAGLLEVVQANLHVEAQRAAAMTNGGRGAVPVMVEPAPVALPREQG